MPALERLDDVRWRIPKTGGMRVDGIVYASEAMMADLREDASLEQVANVAHLPGILDASIAMPDVHWGYGFPIGGVAAMDADDGVVSPGGVGYDINCGVRLLTSRLDRAEVEPLLPRIADRLFARVPTGVGATRNDLSLGRQDLAGVLARGAAWAVERGLGERRDLETIEEGGALPGADPEAVSERAYARGRDQLGTLGSGNHFAEVQAVDEVFDEEAAAAFGLAPGRVTVMIHSGSRGLGHQVASEHIQVMLAAASRYGISLPDRQLCCAPLASPEGRRYLAAMAAAANFAFANRQVMTHKARESFAEVLGRPLDELAMEVVYDVCHNIAKLETFAAPGGGTRRACVHRKGATRAYPPGHPQVPERYRAVGQPVLIPGDMGRSSFVLAGAPGAYTETFGSACHGAGRRLSRKAAKKAAKGRSLLDELARRGVHVRAAGMATVAEEMPEAYKDVSEVVDVVARAGIATKVARLKPLAVVKG
ncbi:MAG TPA: RtcB family protein [Thermoanaerobaculia bacterium]|nr:RtcB family protein [Thermoanaerobaculia bacterium]